MPCSRSRTTAAPARMIASIVTLLMMPMTLVNHAVVTLGLKAMRTTRLTGDSGRAFRPGEKIVDLGRDDLLRVAGPEPRLHHRGRIDIELYCRAGASPSTSRWKFGGMSMTKVYRPAFISGTTSRSAIGCGVWK